MQLTPELKNVKPHHPRNDPEKNYYAPNFYKSKRELIKTLDELIDATKGKHNDNERSHTFDELRKRINDDFTLNTPGQDIKVAILDRVKPFLETMLKDRKEHIRDLTRHDTTDQTESMRKCWAGIEAALHDLKIKHNDIENTLAAAKKGVIIALARWYYNNVTFGKLGAGNQTHNVLGLYNCVCERYGLEKEIDPSLDESDDQSRTRLSTSITTYINESKFTSDYLFSPDIQSKRAWIESDFKRHIETTGVCEEKIIDVLSQQNPIDYERGKLTTHNRKMFGEELDKMLVEYLHITNKEIGIIDPLTKKPISECDIPEILESICRHIWRLYMIKHGYYNPEKLKNMIIIDISENQKIYVYPTEIFLDDNRDSGMSYNTRTLTKVDNLNKLRALELRTANKRKLYEAIEKHSFALAKFTPQDLDEMSDRKNQYITNRAAHLARFGNKNNALLDAVTKNNVDLSIHLIEHYKADINYQHESGATVLHHAARNGNIKLAQTLIELGANANLRAKHHQLGQTTPMLDALRSGHNELGWILAKKTSRNECNTTLRWAIGTAHLEVAQVMINEGMADINGTGPCGMTALHVAAMYPNHHYMIKLIQQGAIKNKLWTRTRCLVTKIEYKFTPLGAALCEGKLSTAYHLVASGEYTTSNLDNEMYTTLYWLTSHANYKIFNMFYERGFRAPHKADSGFPPLIDVAIRYLHHIQLYLSRNIPVHIRDNLNKKRAGYLNIIQLLLKECAYSPITFRSLLKNMIQFNANAFIGSNDIKAPIKELIQNKEMDSLRFWDIAIRQTLDMDKQFESHSLYIAYCVSELSSYIQIYAKNHPDMFKNFINDCIRFRDKNAGARELLCNHIKDSCSAYHLQIYHIEVELERNPHGSYNLSQQIKALPIPQAADLHLNFMQQPYNLISAKIKKYSKPEIYIAEGFLVLSNKPISPFLVGYLSFIQHEKNSFDKTLDMLIRSHERYAIVAEKMRCIARRCSNIAELWAHKIDPKEQEFMRMDPDDREKYLSSLKQQMDSLGKDQKYKEALQIQEVIENLQKLTGLHLPAPQQTEDAASQAAAARGSIAAGAGTPAGASIAASAGTPASGSSAASRSIAVGKASAGTPAGASIAASAAGKVSAAGKASAATTASGLSAATTVSAGVFTKKCEPTNELTKKNQKKINKDANTSIASGGKRKAPPDSEGGNRYKQSRRPI